MTKFVKILAPLIVAKVVIVLFLFSFLNTCVECFPCYMDECQSGVQYCVSERRRCYLCIDRLDECETKSIPRDCIVYCENVLLNNKVSDLNNTVTELKKVNTEQRQQLFRANATIQEKVISLKRERENVQAKRQEVIQYQESLTASEKNTRLNNDTIVQLKRELGKWRLCVILLVVAAVIIFLVALLVWRIILRPKQSSKDCQREKEDLISKTKPEFQDLSSIGINTHSGYETGPTDSGCGSDNNQSMTSKTEHEITASNENTGNELELGKIINNTNVNISLAATDSFVINHNGYPPATKATKENTSEYGTNHPHGIAPTTDDSGDKTYTY